MISRLKTSSFPIEIKGVQDFWQGWFEYEGNKWGENGFSGLKAGLISAQSRCPLNVIRSSLKKKSNQNLGLKPNKYEYHSTPSVKTDGKEYLS
jgi:hypothetical protein